MTDLNPHTHKLDSPEGVAALGRTADVLDDVAAERARQDARWGEQNHPDGTGLPGDAVAAAVARTAAEHAALQGRLTWRKILAEEVAEAFAETDPKTLREELIQVAAVATAWAEAIDRRALATALEQAKRDRHRAGRRWWAGVAPARARAVGGGDPVSGPAISDEMVDAAALVLRSSVKRHGAFIGTETAERWVRDILAAALVASGWRPEADVLREAADHFAAHWYDRGQAVLIARELRNHAGRATALEPVGALPVADGSFGAVVHEQGGIKGTSKDEGQERSEEIEHG